MKIDHIAVWVDDIEGMKEFYLKYFDVSCNDKYINPTKKYTSYFLTFNEGGARIELMNRPDVAENDQLRYMLKGLAHIALTVGGKETVNELTELFRRDGYTIASEPRTTGDGYYESAVLDPEGNYIELLAE
ncbi:lactoylglutathione lyase [Parabacteroides sp. PFB2-10]|uniref:VOC family protein n=1 Tax=Parabacteroides sp. PFB2-10 TaxID=1742405 RepID=UPI0024770509|nr:VOC family protein [Parabacteroides sp. PFB2-10]MDH6313470.1 lactoylglutathione lyase [Parabacteroides sp. PFB2-10]MDL2245152.1 VOC family protein [Parabacteroides sp. OttesenSCG-928-J18]